MRVLECGCPQSKICSQINGLFLHHIDAYHLENSAKIWIIIRTSFEEKINVENNICVSVLS